MVNGKSLIAVFNTTHETLKAEKLFKEAGIRIRTRIKPRSITSECGMALEFSASALGRIRKICLQNQLHLVGLYRELEKDLWQLF